MKKKLLISLILLINTFPLFSDSRTENIDIFILLDKSLSMENNIEEVKKYINSFIIDEVIIAGDRLVILNFYGKTDDFINELVVSEDYKYKIKNQLGTVNADGRFTDIGNALDRLSTVVDAENDESRLKYMLLITDGKQEAPPGTKYYSPDGSFNHELLKHTNTIQKKGWKIEVLGIGRMNDAARIAEKLSGTYVEVDKADEKELSELTSDFLGIISVVEKPFISPFSRNKESKIVLKIASKNIKTVTDIVVDSIKLDIDTVKGQELLGNIFQLQISPDSVNEISIPVKINRDIEPGEYNGTINFSFSSKNVFTPSSFDINLEIKKVFPLYLSIFIPLLLFILFIALFFMKKAKTSPGKIIDNGFEVYLDMEKLSKLPIILKNNEKLFMGLNKNGIFEFSKIKTDISKGFFIRNGSRIDFNIIDKTFFPGFVDKIENIIGKTVNIRNKSGKMLNLFFKRK